MGTSRPDLSNLVDIDNIPDDIPTKTKIELVANAVGKQNTKINTMSDDIAEIKTLVKSLLLTGKLLIISVPIIAVLFSGAAWLILHVTVIK